MLILNSISKLLPVEHSSKVVYWHGWNIYTFVYFPCSVRIRSRKTKQGFSVMSIKKQAQGPYYALCGHLRFKYYSVTSVYSFNKINIIKYFVDLRCPCCKSWRATLFFIFPILQAEHNKVRQCTRWSCSLGFH